MNQSRPLSLARFFQWQLKAIRFSRQSGISLVVCLLMLVVVLLLGISAAQIALEGEKASRNDRDRQVALQAAEAGLMDAELDIEGGGDKSKSRSHIFAKDKTEGFIEGCGSGLSNLYLGLCMHAPEGAMQAWQTIDFVDESSSVKTVPYGRFTGQSFQAGNGLPSGSSSGLLSAKPPRYIIELMTYNKEGEGTTKDDVTYFYRITAIGFGMRDSTQVVLQTFYRKDGN